MVGGFEIYPWLFREMIFLQMNYPMAGGGQVPMQDLSSS